MKTLEGAFRRMGELAMLSSTGLNQTMIVHYTTQSFQQLQKFCKLNSFERI